MRMGAKPIEFVLLAFFGVFLLYPLAYVFPGSASDEEYHVRLLSFGQTPAEKARVLAALTKVRPTSQAVENFSLPLTVRSFPGPRKNNADQLAQQLRDAGGNAKVVQERHWTLFYFQQALGFKFAGREHFPYFSITPNSPALWECLRNSLFLGAITTLITTLLC